LNDSKLLTKRRSGLIHEIAKHRTLYLMFLPVTIYVLIFCYFPMSGVLLAFKHYTYTGGIFGSPWVGLNNFMFFFKSGKALSTTLNTIGFNLLFLTVYTTFSITIAILMSEIASKLYKKIAQSMMFLPYFISWVVVSSFVYSMFNPEFGTVNYILKAFGADPINIYSKVNYWYFLLPTFYLWKSIGYGTVFYLAAISGIDRECYESAKIDGANVFQRIFRITLPLLKPTVITLVLLSISNVLRGQFDMFYQLIGSNGVLIGKTDIIDTLVFRSLTGILDFGMAAAAGFYQSFLCLFIILTVNFIVRKVDCEYALF